MKKSIKRGLAIATLFCVNTTFALQTVKVKNGDTVTVRVSSKELTRLTAIGNASKISDIWEANDYFDSTVDEDTGAIIIKTKNHAPPMFSFMVKDDTNSVYTVVANQQDIPSETIQFRNTIGQSTVVNNVNSVSTSSINTRKKLIRDLVLSMYKNSQKFFSEQLIVNVELWNETNIQSLATYQYSGYIGTKYILKNISNSTLVLSEQEFLGFGKQVVAVSIDKKKLEPNQSTHFYVVREIQK